MSQSDYIKHKKISNIIPSQLPNILNNKDYVDYKQYYLVNTIENTKENYNIVTIPNTQNVFNMNLRVSNCENKLKCQNDRASNMAYQRTCFPIMKAPGLSVPSNYIKDITYEPCECNYTLNKMRGIA